MNQVIFYAMSIKASKIGAIKYSSYFQISKSRFDIIFIVQRKELFNLYYAEMQMNIIEISIYLKCEWLW